jgi:uncharacterized protein YlxW (UPF0749 family)
MLVFGFLITTQFRITQMAPQTTPGLRAEELAIELKAAKEKLLASDRDKAKLQAQIDTLVKAGSGSGNVVSVPRRDPNLELMAGVIEATGSGVMVTLVEAPEAVNKTRVRDDDLWTVINELLAAGAEGIAVNGQRITAITGIRNVGQRIMINQVYTTSPFQVLATGDPTVLDRALKLRGGVIDSLARYSIRVNVMHSDNIVLPAYGSVPEFRFTKPAQ